MTDGLRELMNRMNSRKPGVRRTAAQAALALPPAQLLELVELEAHRYPYRLQWVVRPLLGSLGALTLTACLLYFALWQDEVSATITLLVAIGWMAVTALIVARDRLKARAKLADVMLQRANLSFLVPTVDMLQIRPTGRAEKRLRRTLQGMLKHVLTKVHAHDGPHISRAQRDALNRLLANPLEDVELTLCVLKALQQVGDATALPLVQRLYTLGVPLRWRLPDKYYKCSQVAEIRWAALECLPFLTAQVEKTQQAQTLLRPAQAEAYRPETLLRAAAPANHASSPEQLLRAQSSL
jgi:hypothetical protein